MRKLLVLPAVLLVVVACGGGAATGSPAGAASSPATTTAAPSTPASAATTGTPAASGTQASDDDDDDDGVVMVADSPLGEILVDAEGRTLYGFTSDTEGESTCYEQCATNWPPLLAEDDDDPDAGEGIDDDDVSTVERTDGTQQVKVGDWPLYYFARDTAPGQTNGQGVNDVWFVVAPDGELIR